MTKPVVRYVVTVEGQYYGSNEFGKAKKPYTIEVRLTEKQAEKMRSFMRRVALPSLLPRKYPDYKRFRTIEIAKVVDLQAGKGAPKSLELMGLADLKNYIGENALPINTDLYYQLESLRQAIKSYKLEPEAFMKEQAQLLEQHKEEIEMRKDFDAINPKTPVSEAEQQEVIHLENETVDTDENKKPQTKSDSAANKGAKVKDKNNKPNSTADL